MYTSLCIARVFDDHRSWQKLINYITNIKAKSKRYHWIQNIPRGKTTQGVNGIRGETTRYQTDATNGIVVYSFFWRD
jgi:hypothetical protein